MFEIFDLENSVHNVEILNLEESKLFSLDAIDIDSDGALLNYELDAPINLNATVNDNSVDLNWTGHSEASSYKIYRSTISGGPYSLIAQSVTDVTYMDNSVTDGFTYYYVVSAIYDEGESNYSNEASVTLQSSEEPIDPVVPDNKRGILEIILEDGIKLEYDLSISEIIAFIDWYESAAAEDVPDYYTFTKDWNLGPFDSRTEYVIYNKIIMFGVNEYTIEEN